MKRLYHFTLHFLILHLTDVDLPHLLSSVGDPSSNLVQTSSPGLKIISEKRALFGISKYKTTVPSQSNKDVKLLHLLVNTSL